MDHKVKKEEEVSLSPCEEEDEDYDFEQERKTRRRSVKRLSANSVHHGSSSRVRHKSGTTSYADLICNAILSTNDARLSLAEIYDWMASNVPGLQSQRYLHSSKGWKNAVRHTLSINPRFRKIARMGRPSWWTVDVDSEMPRHNNVDPHTSSPSGQVVEDVDVADAEVELELFRSRADSEPGFAYPTLSLKRRNTVCNDYSPVNAKNLKFGNQAVNTGEQKITVWQDDGSPKIVTVKTQIRLKTVVSEDTGTQTEEMATQTEDMNSEIQEIQEDIKSPILGQTADYWQFDQWTPSFSAELAPSISDSGFQTLTTLMDDCTFSGQDWQELHLDQSDLDTINRAFTTGWLNDDNGRVG